MKIGSEIGPELGESARVTTPGGGWGGGVGVKVEELERLDLVRRLRMPPEAVGDGEGVEAVELSDCGREEGN